MIKLGKVNLDARGAWLDTGKAKLRLGEVKLDLAYQMAQNGQYRMASQLLARPEKYFGLTFERSF